MKLISIKLATFVCALSLFLSCNSKSPDPAITAETPKVLVEDTLSPQHEIQQNLGETGTTASKGDCIAASTIKLPYSEVINPDKAVYKKSECTIAGIDEFLCGEKQLRYIPFPDFENIEVILVPMDCGDFNYRYFLLTLFENKVVSNKYVEGEWYEPDSDDYKEVTSFTVDADYVITITTKAIENGKSNLKENTKIQIRDDGTFDKVN